MGQMTAVNETRRTIQDFGEQWTRYTDNDGYYGSAEMFADIVGPLLAPQDIAGARVAEIGSGTGRIVRMLLAADAAMVLAIEPSRAIDVLRRNLAQFGARAEFLNAPGEQIPADGGYDYVFSIGVLHHIPDPHPVVAAAFKALRPGGRMLVWLYGQEGNGLYLALTRPLRTITRRMPHFALAFLVWMLYPLLALYIALCRRLPLPMAAYMREVIGRMSPDKRRLVIYDQLNPAYAKYYSRSEAERLLSDHGFGEVRAFHRHGYSWTVIGTKPQALP